MGLRRLVVAAILVAVAVACAAVLLSGPAMTGGRWALAPAVAIAMVALARLVSSSRGRVLLAATFAGGSGVAALISPSYALRVVAAPALLGAAVGGLSVLVSPRRPLPPSVVVEVRDRAELREWALSYGVSPADLDDYLVVWRDGRWWASTPSTSRAYADEARACRALAGELAYRYR